MKKKTTLGILKSTHPEASTCDVYVDSQIGRKGYCNFEWGLLEDTLKETRKAHYANPSDYWSCKIVVPTVFL